MKLPIFPPLIESHNGDPLEECLKLRQFLPHFHGKVNVRVVTVDEEEICLPINSLPKGRAPGLDGITIELFQKCSELIIPDMKQVITHFFKTARLPLEWKESTVAPIPTNENPQRVKDCRLFVLCNTTYKTIANILTNRLKKIILEII